MTATAEIHQRLLQLKKDLDLPMAEEQSPVRFYKLMNTTAAEVLQTIRAMEGTQGLAALSIDSAAEKSAPPSPTTMPASNRPPAIPSPAVPDLSNYGDQADRREPTANSGDIERVSLQPPQVIKTKHGTVTADPNTNTIIVVAEPAVQRVYEQMIRMLDKRRPQVLIECTLVTIDTSDSFSLGVELSAHHGSPGEEQVIVFSSFGLSAVDPKIGALSLIPGSGFNGVLIKSPLADAVVRTLATNSHAKVLSAPKILVNDNATGTLASINEAPYTSVNASTTVATTSFAGYQSAGTTITVTPHISEGEHLQLEYSVQMNNFTSQSSNGIPPPRQTNSVRSKITIPNGSTVIVGGLNHKNFSKSISAVPILGQLPIIEYLFSSRQENTSESTLFVFLRPIILRDDQFQDLKYLSQRDMNRAGLPSDLPGSQPLIIR